MQGTRESLLASPGTWGEGPEGPLADGTLGEGCHCVMYLREQHHWGQAELGTLLISATF